MPDVVFMALRDAQMNILPPHLEWIVQLVGLDRAAECHHNIPGKSLRLV